jgi:hypothetical protein
VRGLRQHRWAVIFAALLLYAGVTAVRFLGGSDVGEGIVLLYLLPIGLLAVYFGPLAGTAAASVSLLLFGVWVFAQDVDVGAIDFLTRLRAAPRRARRAPPVSPTGIGPRAPRRSWAERTRRSTRRNAPAGIAW